LRCGRFASIHGADGILHRVSQCRAEAAGAGLRGGFGAARARDAARCLIARIDACETDSMAAS